MNDDYLWDRSGEPDPEIQRLETVLGRLRSDSLAPPLLHPADASPRALVRPWFSRESWGPFVPGLAAVAAGAALLAFGVWFASNRATTRWEVATLEGTPKIGSEAIERSGGLTVGEWLVTDGASRARLNVGAIGQVLVEPNTRLRLVQASWTDHRLALARGTVHASVWAPPRLFFVETPSAVAVDLGCQYTLEVDDAGAALLSVTSGWVSLERGGRESFVPTGARCETRPDLGPGTPYFQDASGSFRESLSRLDFEKLDGTGREAALAAVLTEARGRDTLTLWHLLARAKGQERARVYDRMAVLVPAPEGVTREGVLGGDVRMLDLWWDELGLGESGWRRAWKKVTG